ncbi:MAG: hypothetical protein LBB04_00290 [Oscillospiraceae bacterium]|jgi:hypothetical protein|nr:hypothetical protein [Oscillospiraceae bacterium]
MPKVSSAEKKQYLDDIVSDPAARGKRNAHGTRERRGSSEITPEDLWKIQAAEIKGRAATTLFGDGDKGGGGSGVLSVLETQQKAVANKLATESNEIQKFQIASNLLGKDVVVRELRSGKFEAVTGLVDFVQLSNDKKKEAQVSVNGKLYPLSAIRGLGDVEKAAAAKKDSVYDAKIKRIESLLDDAKIVSEEIESHRAEWGTQFYWYRKRELARIKQDANKQLTEQRQAVTAAEAACARDTGVGGAGMDEAAKAKKKELVDLMVSERRILQRTEECKAEIDRLHDQASLAPKGP